MVKVKPTFNKRVFGEKPVSKLTILLDYSEMSF
jgi:hypothetical protein